MLRSNVLVHRFALGRLREAKVNELNTKFEIVIIAWKGLNFADHYILCFDVPVHHIFGHMKVLECEKELFNDVCDAFLCDTLKSYEDIIEGSFFDQLHDNYEVSVIFDHFLNLYDLRAADSF